MADETGPPPAAAPPPPSLALPAPGEPRPAAATSAGAPPVAPSPDDRPQPAPMEQVSVRLLHALADGRATLRVHLEPSELGAVDVRVRLHGGELSASFLVERPDTLALLQRDARQLEGALGQAGVGLAGNGLTFDLADQGGRREPTGSRLPPRPVAPGQDDPPPPPAWEPVLRDGLLGLRI